MGAGLVFQYVVIAVAVLLSAWAVLAAQAPALARALRLRIAVPLVRGTRPAWVRALGRRIAPPSSEAGRCGSCERCGPK